MTNKQMTYTDGFHFKFTNDILKANYISMSKMLSYKSNGLHSTDDFEIIPEAITEGGFKFNKFTNKAGNMYKTFRIHIVNQNFDYPYIDESLIIDKWKNNTDILIKKNMNGYAFLKAFQNAPLLPIADLNIFKDVFQTFGAICKNIPKRL